MPRPKGWSKFAGKEYRRTTEGRIRNQAETILRLHGQVKREKEAVQAAQTELRMRGFRMECDDQALQEMQKELDEARSQLEVARKDTERAEEEAKDLRSRFAALNETIQNLQMQLKLAKENCEIWEKKCKEAEKERGYAETTELDMRKFWLRYYDRMTSLVEEIGEDMTNTKMFE